MHMFWDVGGTIMVHSTCCGMGGTVFMVQMYMLWNVDGAVAVVACVTFAFRCPHFLDFF